MESLQTCFPSIAVFGMSYALVVMVPGPNMALAAKAGLTMSPANHGRTVAGIRQSDDGRLFRVVQRLHCA
jgi:hypothetical protein